MALPFLEDGLLPPGVHDATLDEVETHFGQGDWRSRLIRLLREYLAALKVLGAKFEIVIDGSFAMKCVAEPNDIDVILVLPANWDVESKLDSVKYDLVARDRTQLQYCIDVFPVRSGSDELAMWVEFFGQINAKWRYEFSLDDKVKKGLIRVTS